MDTHTLTIIKNEKIRFFFDDDFQNIPNFEIKL